MPWNHLLPPKRIIPMLLLCPQVQVAKPLSSDAAAGTLLCATLSQPASPLLPPQLVLALGSAKACTFAHETMLNAEGQLLPVIHVGMQSQVRNSNL